MEPIEWKSRGAALHGASHCRTWRERVAQHREKLACTGLEPLAPVRREHEISRAATETCKTEASAVSTHNATERLKADLGASARALAQTSPPMEQEPPSDRGDDEDPDGDWWGQAMRVDVARYVARRSAQLYESAATSEAAVEEFRRLDHPVVQAWWMRSCASSAR